MQSLVPLMSVAAGGAIGATARYSISLLLSPAGRFPWATLASNLVGCFLAGALAMWLSTKLPTSTNVQLFLLTGLLGGFTTFSAFSVESLRLVESGQVSTAIINVVANVVGSLLAVTLGWFLLRRLLG